MVANRDFWSSPEYNKSYYSTWSVLSLTRRHKWCQVVGLFGIELIPRTKLTAGEGGGPRISGKIGTYTPGRCPRREGGRDVTVEAATCECGNLFSPARGEFSGRRASLTGRVEVGISWSTSSSSSQLGGLGSTEQVLLV